MAAGGREGVRDERGKGGAVGLGGLHEEGPRHRRLQIRRPDSAPRAHFCGAMAHPENPFDKQNKQGEAPEACRSLAKDLKNPYRKKINAQKGPSKGRHLALLSSCA